VGKPTCRRCKVSQERNGSVKEKEKWGPNMIKCTGPHEKMRKKPPHQGRKAELNKSGVSKRGRGKVVIRRHEVRIQCKSRGRKRPGEREDDLQRKDKGKQKKNTRAIIATQKGNGLGSIKQTNSFLD